jgi:hypothetical protein
LPPLSNIPACMDERSLESILLQHGYTEPYDSFSEPLITRLLMDLLKLEHFKNAGNEASDTTDDTCNDLFEAATAKVAHLMADLKSLKTENEFLKDKVNIS